MKAPIPTILVLLLGVGLLWFAIRQAEKGESKWRGTTYKQSENPFMFWLNIAFLTFMASMGILTAILFQIRE